MNIIEKLNWRYATKKFDSSYKLNESEVELVKSVIQLSPASYGLQPYKVLIVNNPDVREKLKEVSWNQPQITDSSALLVFVRNKVIDETEVDTFVDNIVKTRSTSRGIEANSFFFFLFFLLFFLIFFY
jgi:nitroreductase